MPARVAGTEPTPSNDEDAPLDESVLEGLRELQGEDEPDILEELIEIFLEEASPQLATLREAVEEGDTRTVKHVSHTLKGCSANMGAPRMSALCASLEEVGGSEDLSRASGLLDRLDAEFLRVRQALLPVTS